MEREREVRPGWLPPRAPGAEPAPPAGAAPGAAPAWAPPRPSDAPPGAAPADRPRFVAAPVQTGPSSALAVCAIVLASVSIALLFVSVGVGYVLSAVMAAAALAMGLTVRRRLASGVPGRPGQARAAVVVASIALGLAVMAGIIWLGLESSGFSPEDLERWLQDELERRRDRPGEVPGELA